MYVCMCVDEILQRIYLCFIHVVRDCVSLRTSARFSAEEAARFCADIEVFRTAILDSLVTDTGGEWPPIARTVHTLEGCCCCMECRLLLLFFFVALVGRGSGGAARLGGQPAPQIPLPRPHRRAARSRSDLTCATLTHIIHTYMHTQQPRTMARTSLLLSAVSYYCQTWIRRPSAGPPPPSASRRRACGVRVRVRAGSWPSPSSCTASPRSSP